jgi:hypothetical protein
MTRESLSTPPAEDAALEPAAERRLGTIRQRLAEGYYRRPEILDRIAIAVRRALGGPD